VTDETTSPASEDDAAAASPPEAPASRPSTSRRKAKRQKRERAADDVEFSFKGEEVEMRGVPAADLTQAEVDRLVYRRTIPEPGASGLRRGEAGFSEVRAKVVRELMATGHFTRRS
jgi:hypothetical protein